MFKRILNLSFISVVIKTTTTKKNNQRLIHLNEIIGFRTCVLCKKRNEQQQPKSHRSRQKCSFVGNGGSV